MASLSTARRQMTGAAWAPARPPRLRRRPRSHDGWWNHITERFGPLTGSHFIHFMAAVNETLRLPNAGLRWRVSDGEQIGQ